MANEKIKEIFAESRCLRADMLLKYKNDELSGDELKSVEQHLSSCQLCSESLNGLEYVDSSKFRELLNEINDKVDARVKEKYFFRNKGIVFSIAASILIIMSSIYFLTKSSEEEKIFYKYFEVYPNITSVSRSTGPNSKLQSIMILYSAGDFKSFLEKSENITSFFPNDTLTFYRGVAFLASDEIEKGINSLAPLVNIQNNFHSEANWYSALGYIKNCDSQKAVQYLNRIKNVTDYSDKIKLLLIEIRSDE